MTSRRRGSGSPRERRNSRSGTPEGLLEFRNRAFAAGDFGRVWDCYHPASNFRQTFPDRAEYREYGRTRLAGQFVLTGWQVLQLDLAGDRARVLALDTFSSEGETTSWFEWIRLQSDAQGWRIVEIARLERERFAGAPEEFDWQTFERLSDMIFF